MSLQNIIPQLGAHTVTACRSNSFPRRYTYKLWTLCIVYSYWQNECLQTKDRQTNKPKTICFLINLSQDIKIIQKLTQWVFAPLNNKAKYLLDSKIFVSCFLSLLKLETKMTTIAQQPFYLNKSYCWGWLNTPKHMHMSKSIMSAEWARANIKVCIHYLHLMLNMHTQFHSNLSKTEEVHWSLCQKMCHRPMIVWHLYTHFKLLQGYNKYSVQYCSGQFFSSKVWIRNY